MSPFSQHSSPESRRQELEVTTALPAVPMLQPSLHRAKGEALVGGAEGLQPLWTPPCTLPYLFPLARNLCLSSANLLRLYTCRYRHPPMGGGKGTRPCLLHFFYLGTIPDKITSVCSVFSLLAPLTAFFHTCSLCLLKLSSSGSLLEGTRI